MPALQRDVVAAGASAGVIDVATPDPRLRAPWTVLLDEKAALAQRLEQDSKRRSHGLPADPGAETETSP